MRGRFALNVLNFFTAAVQAGFGPFVAVWLTISGWSLSAIGLALGIGTVAQLVAQVPGGLLVDHVHDKRLPAGGALAVLGLSALLLAARPAQPLVWTAEILHALASAVMTPSLAALTLALCGHAAFGRRLGANNRYASLGNAAAAALLGAAASAVSERAVFLLTAVLILPGLATLPLLRSADASELQDDHHALRHPRRASIRSGRPFASRPCTSSPCRSRCSRWRTQPCCRWR